MKDGRELICCFYHVRAKFPIERVTNYAMNGDLKKKVFHFHWKSLNDAWETVAGNSTDLQQGAIFVSELLQIPKHWIIGIMPFANQ